MFKTVATGFKRLVASALAPLIALLISIPDPAAQAFATALSGLASIVGVAGVGHAAYNGNLKTYVLSTITVLITLSTWVPFLQPYHDILIKVAAFLGAGALGQKYGEVRKEKEILPRSE